MTYTVLDARCNEKVSNLQVKLFSVFLYHVAFKAKPVNKNVAKGEYYISWGKVVVEENRKFI